MQLKRFQGEMRDRKRRSSPGAGVSTVIRRSSRWLKSVSGRNGGQC